MGPWNPVNSPVEVGSWNPIYLEGFIHLRWCRISSINNIIVKGHQMAGFFFWNFCWTVFRHQNAHWITKLAWLNKHRPPPPFFKYPPRKTNMAGWKINISNRRYILTHSHVVFVSIVMFRFPGCTLPETIFFFSSLKKWHFWKTETKFPFKRVPAFHLSGAFCYCSVLPWCKISRKDPTWWTTLPLRSGVFEKMVWRWENHQLAAMGRCSVFKEWEFLKFFILQRNVASIQIQNPSFSPRKFESSKPPQILSRWWQLKYFYFHPTWGDDPIWLLYFSSVETTT